MSFHPEDTEKLRRAFSANAEQSDQGTVDDERIWRAVRGELSQKERHAVIEEMAHDPAMAESWRIAKALSNELGDVVVTADSRPGAEDVEDATPQVSGTETTRVVPAAVTPRPWIRRQRWGVGLTAAAALLALSIGLSQSPWETGPTSEYRQASEDEVVSLLDDGERLPRQGFTLRWSAADDARYRLRLLTPDLQVLLDVDDLESNEYRVEAERLSAMPSGSRLLWQVDAHLPDGRQLTSATFFAEVQ